MYLFVLNCDSSTPCQCQLKKEIRPWTSKFQPLFEVTYELNKDTSSWLNFITTRRFCLFEVTYTGEKINTLKEKNRKLILFQNDYQWTMNYIWIRSLPKISLTTTVMQGKLRIRCMEYSIFKRLLFRVSFYENARKLTKITNNSDKSHNSNK